MPATFEALEQAFYQARNDAAVLPDLVEKSKAKPSWTQALEQAPTKWVHCLKLALFTPHNLEILRIFVNCIPPHNPSPLQALLAKIASHANASPPEQKKLEGDFLKFEREHCQVLSENAAVVFLFSVFFNVTLVAKYVLKKFSKEIAWDVMKSLPISFDLRFRIIRHFLKQ